MSKKVLITDAVHPILISSLEGNGYQVDYKTDYTNVEVGKYIHLYTGIIINSKIQLTANILDKAKGLKFIGRLGSGMEIIDVKHAQEIGIKCYNSPEGNRDAVAEHAIGMLLALFNKLLIADAETKNFVWNREQNRGLELKGKTVSLLGYGNTGKAMAKKLNGFEVKVLAYDKYLENYSDQYAKEATLEEIQTQTDILSLHLPLTTETKGFIDEGFVKKFKKPFYIINTSRGLVLPNADLVNSLKSKKIIGACLDVFENENPKTYNQKEKMTYETLFAMKNVIVSPHIAGWTKESKKKLSEILAKKILINHRL